LKPVITHDYRLFQYGIFECQSCGTQYSLEEARKLLVDVEQQSENNSSSKPSSNSKEKTSAKLNKKTKEVKMSKDDETRMRMYTALTTSADILKR